LDGVASDPRDAWDGHWPDEYVQLVSDGRGWRGKQSFSDDSRICTGDEYDDLWPDHGDAEPAPEFRTLACCPNVVRKRKGPQELNTSSVLVRFLSLLDITLILLGVLIVVLMQTSVTPAGASVNSEAASTSTLKDQITFLNLYAGWQGEQQGRCYLLDESMKVGDEVSTTTDSDIKRLIGRRQNVVVLLARDKEGWAVTWDQAFIEQLESIWKVQITEVFIEFPQTGD
jgi:hypothetical protein